MDSSFKICCATFLLSSSWIFAEQNSFCLEKLEEFSLFQDLELAEVIRQEVSDTLPFIYNYSSLGGCFYIPSARMDTAGISVTNITATGSHQIYGIGFQFLDWMQLSTNYHIYKKLKTQNAARTANVKIGLILEQEGWLPSLAIGANDFIGVGPLGSQYIVMSKQFLNLHLECSLGWGTKSLGGIFAGISWSPFRKSAIGFLKNISFVAEYSSLAHKNSLHGKRCINTGLVFSGGEYFQFSVASLQGKDIAVSGCLQFPLGIDQKAKPRDPCLYTSPINTEPLGYTRSEQDLSQEIAYALKEQGLDLYKATLQYDISGDKQLCIKIINTRYREECVVRERIQSVLAALIPADIMSVLVLIEENGVNCQAYCFDMHLLQSWYQNQISDFECNALIPLQEVPKCQNEYETVSIFQRHKPIWTFVIHPRILTFFGTNTGKFKYNIGAILLLRVISKIKSIIRSSLVIRLLLVCRK